MHLSNEPVTIYHNPACSKSRETLAIIREHGIEPHIVEYLKTPPDADTIRAIIERLKIRPEELIRHAEHEFKEHFAGKRLDDEAWIQALAKHPKLMQRPIVIRGKHAALGRPPENVLQLLNEPKNR